MSTSSFKIAHKLLTGPGAIEQLAAELTRLDVDNPLIVTDAALVKSGTVALALEHLGERTYEIFDRVLPDPEIAIVEDCMRVYREGGHDGLIGVGGGSAIDIAKSVAAYAGYHGALADLFGVDQVPRKGPPLIAIPTTAGSGSEATQFTVISDSDSDEKMLCPGMSFLPFAAIIDYELTLSMPPRLTADTGVDALAHAVEAYVSRKANPISDAMSLSAIGLVSAHLRRAYHDGSDRAAREAMMAAATQAGMAFSNSSVTLVHGMSRPIGAHFHVAHGLSNAMLFPAVTAFSVSGAEARYAQCARAYGVADTGTDDHVAARRMVDALIELCRDLEVPTPESYGIDHDAWTRLTPLMAEQAIASGSPANNPVVPAPDDIERIYAEIYA